MGSKLSPDQAQTSGQKIGTSVANNRAALAKLGPTPATTLAANQPTFPVRVILFREIRQLIGRLQIAVYDGPNLGPK